MKVLIIALALGFSSTLFAGDEMFEAKKNHMLQQIDEKAKLMSDKKACVSSAADKNALKSCHKAFREASKKMKEEKKAWRKSMKDKKAAMKAKKDE